MKKIKMYLAIIGFTVIFYNLPAWAQQNLFNIPSGQMTPEKKIFYQHQMNVFSKSSLASKQHLAFGLTNNLEVGLNYINFYPLVDEKKTSEQKSSPETNILTPTIQKSFNLNQQWVLNIGTQTGYTNIGTSFASNLTSFSYAISSYYNRFHHFRLTAGNWISDKRFNGQGNQFGVLAGVEWMYAEGQYFMMDWISGNTKNSVSVIGGMVDLHDGIQLCYGFMVPNPNSLEGNGLVFEINLFTL